MSQSMNHDAYDVKDRDIICDSVKREQHYLKFHTNDEISTKYLCEKKTTRVHF